MKFFDEALPWYKANLHTHTTVSDGRKTPDEVERIFREQNYQILALTDHRRVSPGREAEDFILLSGTELDTVYGDEKECFHIIGLNLPANAVFDDLPRDSHPQAFIDRIHALGGIAHLAHPQWSLNQPESIGILTGLYGVEVYNSTSAFPWNADRADSSQILDLAAKKGCFIPQIAADDCHWYNGDQCQSYTMIQAKEFTADGILDALKNGKFYASRGPRITQAEVTDNQVKITCSPCAAAIFYSNSVWVANRSRVTPEGATEYVYDIQKGDRFVRVELIDENGKKAWLSPFPVNRG